jgi:hypothetical protein
MRRDSIAVCGWTQIIRLACPASLSLQADSSRVTRALRQYELALREWYLGGEWLALGHLWIAVENLTEAVLRRTKLELSKTDKELAGMLDVVTDDPDRPRWPQIMREQIREQVIFDGDHETYVTAKKASDGLEHGFLELDKVARHAIASADTTFTGVRRTIIDLLGLPGEIGAQSSWKSSPKTSSPHANHPRSAARSSRGPRSGR